MVLLKISKNSQENTCARVSSRLDTFIKKETLAKVFSCDFCEIFKNIFSIENLWPTASEFGFWVWENIIDVFYSIIDQTNLNRFFQ